MWKALVRVESVKRVCASGEREREREREMMMMMDVMVSRSIQKKGVVMLMVILLVMLVVCGNVKAERKVVHVATASAAVRDAVERITDRMVLFGFDEARRSGHVQEDDMETGQRHRRQRQRRRLHDTNDGGGGETIGSSSSSVGNPIRFTTSFQITTLSPEEQAYIVGIVGNATERLSRTISLRDPVEGALLLQHRCEQGWRWSQSGREECGVYADNSNCFEAKHRQQYFGDKEVCTGVFPGDCTTTPGGSGAEDTDFILYVTATDNENCSSGASDETGTDRLAQGGFCAVDEESGRPLAGAINFCPGAIDLDTGRPDVDVAVHEIVHALVFSSELYALYTDADGNVRGYENVVGTNATTGESYLMTPLVVEAARQQAACESIAGALLENEGAQGTAGVHWESRHYRGETMVGTTPSVDVPTSLSNLTLALFEDSGWYLPHYCMADLLLWQYRAGCDAYYARCSDRPLPEALESSFCSSVGTTACVYDYSSVGVCSPMTLNAGCRIIEPYNNLQCTVQNFGDDEPSDEDDPNSPLFWGQAYGGDSRCLPMVEGDTSRRIIRDGIQVTTYSRSNLGGGCFTVECEYDDANEATVYVSVFGKRMECKEGEMVNLSGSSGFLPGSRIGPCPPPSALCATFPEGEALAIAAAGGGGEECESESGGSSDGGGDGQRSGEEDSSSEKSGGSGDDDDDDDDDGNFFTACFPSSATALTEDGREVPLAQLRVGDSVAVPSSSYDDGDGIRYERILSFSHFLTDEENAVYEFTSLEVANEVDDRSDDGCTLAADDNALASKDVEKADGIPTVTDSSSSFSSPSLSWVAADAGVAAASNMTATSVFMASDHHLIPVLRRSGAFSARDIRTQAKSVKPAFDGSGRLVKDSELMRASDIVPGDILLRHDTHGTLVPAAVVRVWRSHASGLINPHTASGYLFIDGVVASCYTSAVPTHVADIALAPAHWLRHVIFAVQSILPLL